MNEEGPYNGSFIGARYSPEEREHILEIPYLAIPLLYNGPFQKESPFGYFTTIPQPPSADNIHSPHPLPTLRAPASEAEINSDIARRENMRILNTNVGGAYSTPELLWFMDKTNERSALRASQQLIYSLQENGTTPDKQIMHILRSRRALNEGVLLIPEHVVLIPDIPTAPTRWDGSAASLFAPSDPPRAIPHAPESVQNTFQAPYSPHPPTTLEGSEPVIIRLTGQSLERPPTQLITTNALEPSTLISTRPDTNEPNIITLESGEVLTRRFDDYSLSLSGGRPIWRPTLESGGW